MSTPAVEEYLELLYRLNAADSGVRPADVARQLGVSTAAVAEMLARLEAQGLVRRDDRRAVFLTRDGQRLGQAQVRKHRLVERLLYSLIGRPWDAVHEEACRFEHVMTDDLTNSLEAALGKPSTCPHGNPIPGEGTAHHCDVGEEEEQLAVCRIGQQVVVARISDERADILKYMLTLGLLPGAPLVVEQVAPFGGPLMIRVGDAHYALGRDVAESVWVRVHDHLEEASAGDDLANATVATVPAL